MTAISSFLIFPDISWWMQVVDMDVVILDRREHFEKMSGRNRYRIAGSNNSVLLSVPLVNGRNQHVPTADIRIHNEERWQVQHWRTLVSVYKRSPYFEFYEQGLQRLFDTKYELLSELNKATIVWVKEQLRLKFQLQETDLYVKEYAKEITDLRDHNADGLALPRYHQIFEDRIGFVPNLSILDLLFSEGPMAAGMLRR